MARGWPAACSCRARPCPSCVLEIKILFFFRKRALLAGRPEATLGLRLKAPQVPRCRKSTDSMAEHVPATDAHAHHRPCASAAVSDAASAGVPCAETAGCTTHPAAAPPAPTAAAIDRGTGAAAGRSPTPFPPPPRAPAAEWIAFGRWAKREMGMRRRHLPLATHVFPGTGRGARARIDIPCGDLIVAGQEDTFFNMYAISTHAHVSYTHAYSISIYLHLSL